MVNSAASKPIYPSKPVLRDMALPSSGNSVALSTVWKMIHLSEGCTWQSWSTALVRFRENALGGSPRSFSPQISSQEAFLWTRDGRVRHSQAGNNKEKQSVLASELETMDSSLLYWLGLITFQLPKPNPTQAVIHSIKIWMGSIANTERVLSRSKEPAEPLGPPDPSLLSQLVPSWKESLAVTPKQEHLLLIQLRFVSNPSQSTGLLINK